MEGFPSRRAPGRRRDFSSCALPARLGLAALVVWMLLCAPAGAITLAPDDTPQGQAIERVPIGKPGELKDYLRIDTPCPLRILGPGTLDFFLRAHVPAGGPEAVDVTVTLDGLAGFEQQRWVVTPRFSAAASYGDSRPGGLTGGEKLSLAIPAGLHEVVVAATGSSGAPVYAIFYYSGQPAPPRGTALPAASGSVPGGWLGLQLDSDVALGIIYDDNVARLSDATLKLFQDNIEPWRFAITNREDMIVDTQVQVAVSRPLLYGRPATLRARYERWDYLENTVKNNDEIQVRLRHNLRGSNYLDAGYTYAPDNYIKELGDREPYMSRTTTPYTYFPFYITRNAFDALYFHKINDWLRVIVLGGRVLRFYNQRFLENDLWEWNAGIEPEARYGRFNFRLRYFYQTVEARGVDTVGETLEETDNDGDGSYETDAYRFRLTYRPKAKPFRPGPLGSGIAVIPGLAARVAGWIDAGLVKIATANIYFQYDYNRQHFTSEKPLFTDPLHVGRLDQQFQPRLVWTSKALATQAVLEAGIRYTRKTAESPAGVIGEDDPSEEKDYTGTRVWLQSTWPLPW